MRLPRGFHDEGKDDPAPFPPSPSPPFSIPRSHTRHPPVRILGAFSPTVSPTPPPTNRTPQGGLPAPHRGLKESAPTENILFEFFLIDLAQNIPASFAQVDYKEIAEEFIPTPTVFGSYPLVVPGRAPLKIDWCAPLRLHPNWTGTKFVPNLVIKMTTFCLYCTGLLPKFPGFLQDFLSFVKDVNLLWSQKICWALHAENRP